MSLLALHATIMTATVPFFLMEFSPRVDALVAALQGVKPLFRVGFGSGYCRAFYFPV